MGRFVTIGSVEHSRISLLTPGGYLSPIDLKYEDRGARGGELEGVIMVLGRAALLGLLMLVVATSVTIPAQAFSKNPPPWKQVCYEVVGRDQSGVSHDVSFYHRWSATKLAAAWVAEGWTDVYVDSC